MKVFFHPKQLAASNRAQCRIRIAAIYFGLSSAFLFAPSASSEEQTGYEYDALGRLVRVRYAAEVDGGGGLDVDYAYDAAGNRQSVAVADGHWAGALPPPEEGVPASGKLIVVNTLGGVVILATP